MYLLNILKIKISNGNGNKITFYTLKILNAQFLREIFYNNLHLIKVHLHE
jgi:hypothetical protein